MSRVMKVMRFTANQPPEPYLLELIEVTQTTNVLLGDSHNDQAEAFHTSTFLNFDHFYFSNNIVDTSLYLKIIGFNL